MPRLFQIGSRGGRAGGLLLVLSACAVLVALSTGKSSVPMTHSSHLTMSCSRTVLGRDTPGEDRSFLLM